MKNNSLKSYARMNQKPQGFTLLEVLVALAIFAISALVIMEQSTRSVHQLTRLEEKTLALWVAENSLAEVRLDQPWPNTGNNEFVVNSANREWRVEQLIENTSNENLRKIVVNVFREEHKNSSTNAVVTLTSFVGEH